MKKCFLSLVLVLCVVISLFTAFVQTVSAYTDGYYTYEISDGEATITGINRYSVSLSDTIAIPSELGGCPVTIIGDYVFNGCSFLKNITIPDSVKSIGEGAFFSCDNLISIILPDSVTNIGDKAFSRCYKLSSVTISDRMASISNEAFSDCYSLYNITIPEGVTSIGNKAFSGSSLRSITIPENVISIGDEAFSDCAILYNIEIIDSVISIGSAAFSNTSWYNGQPDGLVYIGQFFYTIKGNNTGYTTIELQEGTKGIAGSAFSGCRNLTSITLPDTMTSIGEYAFYGCSGLTSITLPDGVASIGGGAFSSCNNLTSITLPDSVTSIGIGAFTNCSNLTSITLPDGVTSIGAWAFEGCSSLTSVTIPDSMTSIGSYAFYGCRNLTSITLPDTLTSIGEYAFTNCSNLTSITLPDGVASIGGGAFSYCHRLTSITLPDGVTSIGARAFEGCSSLTSVTIPDSMTSIGSYAFSHCSGLTSITLPNSVTRVGGYAFESCSSLRLMRLPGSLTSIDPNAFYDCNALKTVYKPKSATWSYSFDSKVKIIYTCQVMFIGEYESTQTVNYNSKALLPTAPSGYTYLYTANGVEWHNEPITDDITINVQKLKQHKVNFIGAYESIQNVAHGKNVILPDVPYGYIYTYTINGTEWINEPITDNITITVSKTPKKYQVHFIGAYEDIQIVEYGKKATLIEAPYGYIYAYTANGVEWNDDQITEDITITVQAFEQHQVSFTGAYEDTQTVIHAEKAVLPDAPDGYIYTYMVNGEKWDNEPITDDITITVTKTHKQYQVQFIGDYENAQTVIHGENAVLPNVTKGYIYTYTVNGEKWDNEPITDDITITVTKLCDMAEISSINLENAVISGTEIRGEFYQKVFTPQTILSENASYTIYNDPNLNDSVTQIILNKGLNTFYIKVVAQSGREAVYTVTVDRAIPDSLGALMIKQTVGNSMVFTTQNTIVGNPVVMVMYGTRQDDLIHEAEAIFSPENQTFYITGLPEGKRYYFKALAMYEDVTIESSIVYEQTAYSNNCYVLSVLSPAGGKIDHENGIISDLRVTNKFDSVVVDVEVSRNAIWDLYYTATSSMKYENRTLMLNEGRTKTAYIRVVAEDGTQKTYSISIYRQTKSDTPTITVTGNKATITGSENSKIIYTVDGSDPSEFNGMEYVGEFTVSPGMVIKATAKEYDKDEYSDIAVYSITRLNVAEITPIDIYKTKNEIIYDFFVGANENISASFIIAVYDKLGKIVGVNFADNLTNEREKEIYGSFTTNDSAYSYKAFLWSSLNSLQPVADAVADVLELGK